MIVSVSGSRDGSTPYQHQQVKLFIKTYHEYIEELHHGQCKGFDEEVHDLAMEHSIKIVIHPATKQKYLSDRKSEIMLPPKEYLERNKDLSQVCHLLIAAPSTEEEVMRSGTWSTIRYARKKGKKIWIIPPERKEMDSGDSLETVLNAVRAKRNILLHGPGGVGKSWLFKKIIERLSQHSINVCATALTGVAALNLNVPDLPITATTLHRFSGIKTGNKSVEGLINMVNSDRRARNRIRKCDVLIIDEISMLGSSLFHKLNEVFKSVREDDTIFGGIQLIAGGDFLQLPPVKDDWVFNTEEWDELDLRPFILEVPHRYTDVDFFKLLLRVRLAEHTKDDVKVLKKRVKSHRKLLDTLKELEGKNPAEVIKPTVFFPKKAQAEAYNHDELVKLTTPVKTFTSSDEITSKKGKHLLRDYQFLLEENIPEIIELKEGAQVMLKINMDTDLGLVNGSRGVITNIVDGEAVNVTFINGVESRIERHNFEFENKEVSVVRTQIPLVLAYAMTIHKSQSASMDYIVADLGPDIFSHGQSYVGLSRCSDVKGLFISEFHPEKITADEEAKEYNDTIRRKSDLEDIKVIVESVMG